MKRFIEGLDRSQTTLLPECIDDYVDGDNSVRAVDTFVDMLDLAALGFDVEPEATGRPGYYPGTIKQPSMKSTLCREITGSRCRPNLAAAVGTRPRPQLSI